MNHPKITAHYNELLSKLLAYKSKLSLNIVKNLQEYI